MAYYDEENEDPLNPNNQGGVTTGGGQSSTVNGQGAAPTSNGAPNAPDKSGSFVGIKTYLDANKNQASKLGDQASGVINNSADQARSSLNNLKTTFNNSAGSAINLDQNAINQVGQAENINAADKQTIKNQYNAQYAGPSDLFDNSLSDQYLGTQKALKTAKENIQNSGTEEGRKNLITQINDKSRTNGATTLDGVLLQSGDGRNKLAQAAQANQNVNPDMLFNANTEAAQKAAGIKATNDATRTATRSAVGNATSQFEQSLGQRVEDAIKGITKQNQAATSDLGDQSSLDAATMTALGLNEGDQLYGLDLNKYYNQGDPNSINASNVANQNDYQRYLALADLAGIDPTVLQESNRAQAGTAKGGSFAADKFKIDLQGKSDAYKAAYGVDNKLLSKRLLDNLAGSFEGAGKVLSGGTSSYHRDQLAGMSTATPKEIEEIYLPRLQEAIDGYGSRHAGTANNLADIKKEIVQALDKQRNDFGTNIKVKSSGK